MRGGSRKRGSNEAGSEEGPCHPLNQIEQMLETKDFFPHKYEQIYEPPNFSIKELRDAIPAHLFQRSLLKSSVYLGLNLLVLGALFWAATWIPLLPPHLTFVAWPLYWWFQGVAGFGVWVVAHECGHQSFSAHRRLNHALGFLLHSLLLVPYHNWRISHAIHHANTANLEQDQNYVPRTKSQFKRPPHNHSPLLEAIEASSIFNLALMLVVLVFGWSAHMLVLKSGQSYPGQTATLILPSSPVFRKEERLKVLYSNAAVLLCAAALLYLGYTTSFSHVLQLYVVPHVLVHAWLVTVTFLHHTDVYLPHYSKKAWTFTRGGLATVDRDYGWFLNTAFHHIHDSHVVHHLFSQMPHYHAIQATPYLKQKLGEYYLYDKTPFWKALYRGLKCCKYVEDQGDVLFYRKG